MRISRILLPAALIAASSLAFANDPASGNNESSEKHGTLSFAKLDKNQDGQLTKAELPASSMYSEHFSAIDADGNGSLSKTEVHDHLVAMGISPDKMKKMDHHDMKGMEHDDATDDSSGMDGDDY